MPEQAILALGGILCGLIAGVAAQYGRLCTFSAIEDAVAAGDLRRARAWALALAVAIAITQALVQTGQLDPTRSIYTAGRIELAALAMGSVCFGIGMALIGTCGFGLLVRAGTGDLRAMMMAVVLGIAAFAATAGPLAAPRIWLSELASLRLDRPGTLSALAPQSASGAVAAILPILLVLSLTAFALWSAKVRQRPKLLVAGVVLGSAVACGWVVTGLVADPFTEHRLESLTFVGPIGRALLVLMGESISHASFAVMTVVGVILGSLIVALARKEFRWEAFDDQREMRRHILGAVLMGVGGVMARGCTIGQGISAFSMLAITAPLAISGMIIGARLGLAYLIGRPSVYGSRRTWARRQVAG